MNSETALVLFSGGQNSTVCLAWALERFSRVETIGFDYGQRHAIELSVRARLREKMAALNSGWAARLGDDHMIKLDALAAISDTALTRQTAIEIADSGLPTTFVPGRNLMFFCFAGALAYRRGARHLVAGMCETDYSGYPDCRDDTIKAMQVALTLGLDKRVAIHTPLMWIMVICPNVIIRDRLNELDPHLGEQSLYRSRDIVPSHLMERLRQGRVLIMNWHVLEPREQNSVGGEPARVVPARSAQECPG